MRKIILIASLWLLASPAWAQSYYQGPAIVYGPVTAGDCPQFASASTNVNGLVDSGGPCGGGGGGAVNSVTGTAGQITVSPTTGNTVVSLPSTITKALVFSNTVNFTGAAELNGTAFGSLATVSTSGSDILYGNGSGGLSNVTIGSGLSFSGGTLSATGSSAFSGITTGTNTSATMTVGTGAEITASGSGIIDATELGGATFAAPGSIGSSTASAGAFTTLSASSTVSGSGFSAYLASPPAIGGTAAGAGNFTTLGATGTLTTDITGSTQCVQANSSGQLSGTGATCGSGTGGVTSVGLALPSSVFSVSGSPVTSSGTLTGAFTTQTENTVFAGPSSGSAAAPTFRALVGADLPDPSATTLGGIESITSASNEWVSYIDTSGVPHQSQPAFSNISGQLALASQATGQLPIGNVGSAGLSGTSPIAIASTGAISCSTCLTGNQTITLSGDTTGSGATAITTTTGKVNGVSYGSSPGTNTVPVVTATNATTYEALPLAAMASQSANTVVGNGTGSSAAPTALAVPSCSGSTNALTWTSGTGFGCNTISSSGSPGGSSGDAQYNASGSFGGSSGLTFSSTAITSLLITVPSVSGTSCTLSTGSGGCSGNSTGDCGTFLTFTASSAVTVTLPNSLPVGCQVALEQNGSGQVTLSAGSGATLNSAHSYVATAAQYSVIGVTVNANSGGSAAVYILTGDGAI